MLDGRVPQTCVVTGGLGFVGWRLGQELGRLGSKVVLFDRAPAPAGAPLPPGTAFVQGDLRRYADVAAACKGAHCIFHVGSYGMSGSEMADAELTRQVNIEGTRNVIQAAIACGVPRLVLTSTYNVVYGGQAIDGGDESWPYYPLARHPDEYSRSKAAAEQLVLAADGMPLAGGRAAGALRTCALRPAAIWGAGEQRHSMRMVAMLHAGFPVCAWGSPACRVDWLHCDNLVAAQVLAAKALGPEQVKPTSAGQAYFVSDGAPVNNFEFLRPLIEGLGFRLPRRLWLPLWLMWALAWALELGSRAVRAATGVKLTPLLTRTEVVKCGQTHWFRIDKARRELGYAPRPHSMQEMVEWYAARGWHRRDGCRAPAGSQPAAGGAAASGAAPARG